MIKKKTMQSDTDGANADSLENENVKVPVLGRVGKADFQSVIGMLHIEKDSLTPGFILEPNFRVDRETGAIKLYEVSVVFDSQRYAEYAEQF